MFFKPVSFLKGLICGEHEGGSAKLCLFKSVFDAESNQTSPHIPFYYRYSYPHEFLLTSKRLPFLLECSGDQLIPFPTPIKEFLFLPSPKVLFWDQFRFLGKCPPTPPLSQH